MMPIIVRQDNLHDKTRHTHNFTDVGSRSANLSFFTFVICPYMLSSKSMVSLAEKSISGSTGISSFSSS